MDAQYIEDIILILEGSGASELEVKTGDSAVRIVKSQKKTARQARPVSKKETAKGSAEPTASTDLFITAPMVGIFHSGSSAVAVDQNVTVGQVVGMIESMKIHNEVVSRIGGVVSESMVEDGTPVEFGQPLFRVVPEV